MKFAELLTLVRDGDVEDVRREMRTWLDAVLKAFPPVPEANAPAKAAKVASALGGLLVVLCRLHLASEARVLSSRSAVAGLERTLKAVQAAAPARPEVVAGKNAEARKALAAGLVAAAKTLDGLLLVDAVAAARAEADGWKAVVELVARLERVSGLERILGHRVELMKLGG